MGQVDDVGDEAEAYETIEGFVKDVIEFWSRLGHFPGDFIKPSSRHPKFNHQALDAEIIL